MLTLSLLYTLQDTVSCTELTSEVSNQLKTHRTEGKRNVHSSFLDVFLCIFSFEVIHILNLILETVCLTPFNSKQRIPCLKSKSYLKSI